MRRLRGVSKVLITSTKLQNTPDQLLQALVGAGVDGHVGLAQGVLLDLANEVAHAAKVDEALHVDGVQRLLVLLTKGLQRHGRVARHQIKVHAHHHGGVRQRLALRAEC